MLNKASTYLFHHSVFPDSVIIRKINGQNCAEILKSALDESQYYLK